MPSMPYSAYEQSFLLGLVPLQLCVLVCYVISSAYAVMHYGKDDATNKTLMFNAGTQFDLSRSHLHGVMLKVKGIVQL